MCHSYVNMHTKKCILFIIYELSFETLKLIETFPKTDWKIDITKCREPYKDIFINCA